MAGKPDPLRLWPGFFVVALQWSAWLGGPVVFGGVTGGYVSAIGGLAGGPAVVAWWVFFSRAPRSERWAAVLLTALALVATSRALHESIATGMMGMMFPMYAVPVMSLAFVGWAAASHRLAGRARFATMAATILLASGAWALLRSEGIRGGGSAQFAWRWAETAEERLLARPDVITPLSAEEPAAARTHPEGDETPRSDEPAAAEIEPRPGGDETVAAEQPAAETSQAAWPGFRGPHRDSVIRGTRIETDWAASAPVELWRRAVGPGWSSFAVQGDFLYTQEQRGEDEIVACYRLTTGEPVWRHQDAARFWEANAGAGPRATPTLHGGRVYAFGATGILNALDARDGSVVWSRDTASDADQKIPGWGFASSPLIVDDVVIVAAVGKLVGYDLATGDPRWFGPDGGHTYSSPHGVTLAGVPQVILMGKQGAASVAPADGKLLWEQPLASNTRIVQPAVTADGDLLVSGGESSGMSRLNATSGPAGWTVEQRWESMRLKPYFNDFVVHRGHAFGFDGRILACIDIENGERKWKGGRYGQGQLVLLADQDLLLVLSEDGDLALVSATPDQFTELAKVSAIDGKTWNHPALAGDVLLVRNSEEMAAFRLTLNHGAGR